MNTLATLCILASQTAFVILTHWTLFPREASSAVDLLMDMHSDSGIPPRVALREAAAGNGQVGYLF